MLAEKVPFFKGLLEGRGGIEACEKSTRRSHTHAQVDGRAKKPLLAFAS